jgi:hypothetical protein
MLLLLLLLQLTTLFPFLLITPHICQRLSRFQYLLWCLSFDSNDSWLNVTFENCLWWFVTDYDDSLCDDWLGAKDPIPKKPL